MTQCFDCVNVSHEQCKSPSSSRRRAAAQTRTVTVASSASEQILKVDDKRGPNEAVVKLSDTIMIPIFTVTWCNIEGFPISKDRRE